MKYLVDVGNSCIKWTSLHQSILSPQNGILYQRELLAKLLEATWKTLEKPQAVWVANVAGPEVGHTLSRWIKNQWGITAHFVETQSFSNGVKNGYRNPQQLGIDRWLALIGAYQIESAPFCVVDCGTAVTLDVVYADGQHQGGLIMPGITTMQRALSNNTFALSRFEHSSKEVQPSQLLAQETQAGIALGTVYSIVGLIDTVTNRLEQQGQAVKLVLTGGDAPLLLPLMKKSCRHIPDLVLRGLSMIVKETV